MVGPTTCSILVGTNKDKHKYPNDLLCTSLQQYTSIFMCRQQMVPIGDEDIQFVRWWLNIDAISLSCCRHVC